MSAIPRSRRNDSCSVERHWALRSSDNPLLQWLKCRSLVYFSEERSVQFWWGMPVIEKLRRRCSVPGGSSRAVQAIAGALTGVADRGL